MIPFGSLKARLDLWLKESQGELFIRGVSPSAWSFVYSLVGAQTLGQRRQLILAAGQEEAEQLAQELKPFGRVLVYPGLGHSPYSSILSSESAALQRFRVLAQLALNAEPVMVIATVEAAHLLVPPPDFFRKQSFSVKVDDILSPLDLAQKLVTLGYRSVPSVEEPGTFVRKGEIFDIFPLEEAPIRLHYFDDLIESIHRVDPETQKSTPEKLNSVLVAPCPAVMATENYSTTLRESIPQPRPQFKARFDLRKSLFQQLSQGHLFDNYPVFIPLFFSAPVTLADYFKADDVLIEINREVGMKEWEHTFDSWTADHAAEADKNDSIVILPGPSKIASPAIDISKFKHLVVESLNMTVDLSGAMNKDLHLDLAPLKPQLMAKIQTQTGSVPDNRFELVKAMLVQLREEMRRGGNLVIAHRSEGSRQELAYLLEQNNLTGEVTWINHGLPEGFHYRADNLWVLSEADLFTHKQRKAKKTSEQKPDLFAEQLATLRPGDFVIHRDFGVGKYLGLESLKVGDQESDYVVIEYENRDKVYVPVYRLNLVQKHADANAEAKVANLNSKKFSDAKAKARLSVKKLAFDLLRMQAERKLRGGFPFSPPDHLFKEFEMAFPFEETPDQLKAINDVVEDMQAQTAMDRLVCGDVGFGKTEVAMRAAFKAVLDKKQVAILVPTTVLALQHFHSFRRRFKEFPVNVEMLSRFKTAKEAAEVIAQVKRGEVDILVGTHAVLSDKLEFNDLGLIVIDEEHRFGVNHKEKLKVMRAGVDVLTMTATPIPRTLQLAFLGIRDMSIIQTAPPRRQAIKTYLIKEDDLTLKAAIDKELSRGGQVFYVHNRVHDIEEHEIYLKKLVPGARVTVTHGQMPEKELEKRIADFIDHKSDILLSTTIIESGIDIPNANTMIIDRADTYGLAQLHQLRGRIGRSDRKAYAYFMVPNHRVLTELASRRLQSLQTYADMGSGFALASCDLEIRGAGDIMGAEQHGHIDQVGLEFYLDLLQDAVQELRGEKRSQVRNTEIQAPFNAFIPNDYISDHATRLKYYKRLSNAQTLARLEELADEMSDVFGLAPKEVEALLGILRSRLYFQTAGIRLVKVSGSQVTLFFDQDLLEGNEELRDKVLSIFLGKPKLYKINPDASVLCYFKETVSQQTLLEFAKHVAGQTVT
jgi:transcription-repair coupling factor (superfamily II helicase)